MNYHLCTLLLIAGPCHMGSCFVCNIPTMNLCSSCKSVSYCNKEPQKKVRSKHYLTPLSLPPHFARRTGNHTKSTASRSRQLVTTHSTPSSLPWMKISLVSSRFLGSWFPETRMIHNHGTNLTKAYGSDNQIVLWEPYTFRIGESMGCDLGIAQTRILHVIA